jgi:hypothetical protein
MAHADFVDRESWYGSDKFQCSGTESPDQTCPHGTFHRAQRIRSREKVLPMS